MKCPRCQQDNWTEQKFCGECGTPLAGAIDARPYADLEDENRRLRLSLTEALDQQTATSEILQVISSSPTDLQPVMDTVAERAARLCDSSDAQILKLDGDRLYLVASYGTEVSPLVGTTPDGWALRRDYVTGRAVLDRQVIHVHDLAAAVDTEFPRARAAQVAQCTRTALAAPLLREGVPIGAILIRRQQVRPFSDRQIALLQTFADQAVIAIENVRLFTELQEKNRALTAAHAQVSEALEQQTATADILRIIARSPTELQPTLDTIAQNAVRVCGALDAGVLLRDGDDLVAGSHRGPLDFQAAGVRSPLTRGTVPGRAVLDARPIQVPDIALTDDFPEGQALAERFGVRAAAAVPLLREGVAIGALLIRRGEAGLFSDRQIQLLGTFADQAVIGIENVRLFRELEARNRDLTATGQILQVISRSPTNVQPVFEAIADSAFRLFEAVGVAVARYDRELISLAAARGGVPGSAGVATERFGAPHRPFAGFPPEQTVLTKTMNQTTDVETDPSCSDEFRRHASDRGFRSVLSMPMFREDIPVGVIVVSRARPGAFSTAEVDLLHTFADQAVIAIENVRLFTELQTINRDLTAALDQQTATSDILRAIAHAPIDTQPVFDTIVRSATRLCNGFTATVLRTDGTMMFLDANYGSSPEALARARSLWPRPLDRTTSAGTAVLTQSVVQIPDSEDPSVDEFVRQAGRLLGYRSSLAVPMLRGADAIGAIRVTRREPGLFSDADVELLKTFADQAVIAIENVRLFKELQEKNRALTQAHAQVTEALEQQTATSEILRVISSSPTDAQPVFDTIVRSATRLCRARAAAVFVTDGPMLYEPANYGGSPEVLAATRARYPRPLDRETAAGTAILTRSVVQVPDVEEPSAAEFAEFARRVGRAVGFRSLLSVPMLREGEAVGAINITRPEPGRFSDAEVELLKTFANQAVIAIENVRLFKELEVRTADLTRSVEQLTALGEVGRAVSSTLDLETVLTTIVARAVELSGLDGGVVFEYDDSAQEFVQRVATETGPVLAEARRTTRIRKGEGVLGRTAITLEPVQVPDITKRGAYEGRLRETLIAAGIRAILAVPMVREGQLIGCLAVTRNRPGEFPAETIELLRTFATQSALAIQNARLFHEIEDKSRQLEAASQHKSEFLANMSHELRTPLNAIIGFSEVLGERLFGDLNEKQEEYLKDIHASGQHLLSLINDILDLSKIEAGRMELELTDFDLPTTIDNALTLVRERAGRRGIALYQAADEGLGQIRGDERKIKQVLLNLLSNAIKFTPDGGRIDVRATARDGWAEVSVTDTGVGIAPDDQEAIFEEFRQVGTADKKVEGTGLGLALSRKFIELHGGRIWVTSQIGMGSTFTFTIPTRIGRY
jgi:GAF domain-containing protein